MATKDLEAQVSGFCVTTIIVNKETYPRIKLPIFPNLCADVILGQNWRALHESVTFKYGGSKPEVKVGNVMALKFPPHPRCARKMIIADIDRNVSRMWARAAARDEAMEVAAEIEKVQAEVRQEEVQLDISDESAYEVGDNDKSKIDKDYIQMNISDNSSK